MFMCPLGSRRSDFGACIECDPGTYSDFEDPLDHSTWECQSCAAGTYSADSGAVACVLCPFGTYNPNTASTTEDACILCPNNYQTENEGSTNINQCVQGASVVSFSFDNENGELYLYFDIKCLKCSGCEDFECLDKVIKYIY